MHPPIEKTRESIRKRPGMYIGSRDIDKFAIFISAVHFVETMNDVPMEKRIFNVDWTAFEQWVVRRTGHHLNGQSFAVATALGGDDPLGKWFEWYDEFVEIKRDQSPKEQAEPPRSD